MYQCHTTSDYQEPNILSLKTFFKTHNLMSATLILIRKVVSIYIKSVEDLTKSTFYVCQLFYCN